MPTQINKIKYLLILNYDKKANGIQKKYLFYLYDPFIENDKVRHINFSFTGLNHLDHILPLPIYKVIFFFLLKLKNNH